MRPIRSSDGDRCFFAKNGPERTGDAARFPVLYINVIEEMDIVRKIIRAYLYNPMPEKVQRQFRSWCLREEGSHEKTEALREEWERLDPAAVLPTDEEAYRGKLARLHGEMRPPLRLRHDPALASAPLRSPPRSSCWRCPSNFSSCGI